MHRNLKDGVPHDHDSLCWDPARARVGSQENKRKHFRIDYPEPDRPTIAFDRLRLRVIDLSEKGVKFACNGQFKPKVGHPIMGKIVFHDKAECPVGGTVLRYDDGKDICVVTLTQGIPYPKIMEEQLRIIRKYAKNKS